MPNLGFIAIVSLLLGGGGTALVCLAIHWNGGEIELKKLPLVYGIFSAAIFLALLFVWKAPGV